MILIPRLAVVIPQALPSAERPRIRGGHECAEVVFATLDGFRPPEAIWVYADYALDSLDLFSCHRVRNASPKKMKAATIMAKATKSGFILQRQI
jgi:hypothetical protein